METSIPRALELLGIETRTPLDPDWEFYSATYNTRVPAVPKIVVLPASTAQVSQAVRWAAARGLKVQARSGGHSYASHSNGGVDGCAVVDLRKLQDVSLAPDGVVRVGGGVRLGTLAGALLERRGGRALAHGTCPAVGVGGHFTHGGFGFTSRCWGLATDQVVALDVVMADGRVVRASGSENRDLFVAMRGAADSFGIAVNFYLRTQPAPKSIVKWSVDLPGAMRTIESAVGAFKHIQSFARDASVVDRDLGMVVFLSHNRFTLEGTYLGDIGKFTSKILPALLCGFPWEESIRVDLRQVDWLTLLRLLAGDTGLEVGPSYAEHHMFFAKSACVSHPGLSKDVLEMYFKYLMGKGPSAPVDYFIGVQLYGGADSQITNSIVDDSCAKRDAMWVFQHYGSVDGGGEFPGEGIRFIEGLNKALGPGHGASNNYADTSLGPDEAQKLYYGKKLKGLMRLKGALDPDDVFSHPQSIRKELVSGADAYEGGLDGTCTMEPHDANGTRTYKATGIVVDEGPEIEEV
ncbi:putative glucooligosaccharide oxidase [Rosellinia necatrix]|uniref:Putative glucooligosaccharide oxidase n=1 Tax=Rosellinia necatrix TaxID=77044 RepID=A0A1W2TSQ3_ROSNE|nr:putative glucooligosaccharide oxidase [Rosellinia necatrix]